MCAFSWSSFKLFWTMILPLYHSTCILWICLIRDMSNTMKSKYSRILHFKHFTLLGAVLFQSRENADGRFVFRSRVFGENALSSSCIWVFIGGSWEKLVVCGFWSTSDFIAFQKIWSGKKTGKLFINIFLYKALAGLKVDCCLGP